MDYNFNKCRDKAENAGHYHNSLYLDEADIELTSEDNWEVIKKKDKKKSSNEDPLSSIPEELFEKYKVPSTNINLTDRDNNLQVVLSKTTLLFHFNTSVMV